MDSNLSFHKPVLLKEVLQFMNCQDDEIYLDGTFGAGGYSKALLKAANCQVLAFDKDDSVKKFADELKLEYDNRFNFFNYSFAEISSQLKEFGISGLDGIVYDFGVSSMQLDDKSRGFSFDSDVRLDMRMNKKAAMSAYQVVNELSENELYQIIKEFGEERKAKLIAKKIIEQRQLAKIESCKELADIVRSFYKGYHKIDPATKTFQAIRIYVNDELDEIKKSLSQAVELLKEGGRLITVSFHSLEDSIVKNFFKKEAGLDVTFSRYEPVINNNESSKTLRILTKSAIKPDSDEIKDNPRSRSSRLRAAVKT